MRKVIGLILLAILWGRYLYAVEIPQVIWLYSSQTAKKIVINIIRKTKCFRILERNAKISKTKRNFSRLYPTPQKFKKIDRLRRNEIHLKAVRTSS